MEDKIKIRATAAIIQTYMNNKARLMLELAKDPADRITINNIRAYLHIVRAIEESYDLTGVADVVGERVAAG